MYSDSIIDDVKINNNIKNEEKYESIEINQEFTDTQVREMYSSNRKIIKYFYKCSLAFLVFTSWVYGLILVSLSKKTEHNIHSLTWIPFLLGSYLNILLFGICYFISDY